MKVWKLLRETSLVDFFFSKVKSLPRSGYNFTIKRTYHRFILEYVPKASCLKKIFWEKSIWWSSVLIKMQPFTAQPSILSTSKAHLRASCRSAENANIFISKPLWWRLFVIKKNFMAPFYGWGLTVYHSVPRVSSTHLINLGRIKGWPDLRATMWFWTWDPGLEI